MKHSSKRGMTLIETMVWIAVLVMVTVALSNLLIRFYGTTEYALAEESAISSAQRGMDVAVKALRTASYSSIGAYPIISIAPDQIAFYANVTPNDTYIQQVRLFVQGDSLMEGIVEPSGDPPTYSNPETLIDLSDDVRNVALSTSTFLYYDQNGNQITNYAQFQNLRFVTVNLIVDVSTSSLPNQLVIESSAALRNLITH